MIDLKGIKITDRHVFFWGGWLSNWYKSDIVLEDNLGKEITFHTSEQYFMWRKAMLFNDKYIAEKILDTSIQGIKFSCGLMTLLLLPIM